MNAKQFHAAIDLSTAAALKSGKISLPEIVGILHMAALNAERTAYQHAMQQMANEAVETTKLVLPPNGIQLPKR